MYVTFIPLSQIDSFWADTASRTTYSLTSVLAQPILSNRLLLSMRQVDDTHTRTVVSTLLFSPQQESDSECEGYESNDGGSGRDVPPRSRRDHLTGEKDPVDDESKSQGKKIEISSRC